MIHQGKILKDQVNLSDKKVGEIAELAGVSRNTLYEWYKLEVLENDQIEKLKGAGIDLSINGRQMSYAKTIQLNPDRPKPYYADVNTSAGLSIITNDRATKATSYIDIPNSGADFFINVFGDSMYPKYCAGEIVGLKYIDKDYVMFGHAYVVELINGESFIKYIRKGKDDNHWILASENKLYDDKAFHIDKIKTVYMIKVVLAKTSL